MCNKTNFKMERTIHFMSKIISRINHYFIASEDEHIPASDFIIFYGVMLGLPIYTMIILLGA